MTNLSNEARESIYDCISDMHKDAYGFRPRHWNIIRAMSDSELSSYMDTLQKDIETSIQEQKEREEICVKEWNAHIEKLMNTLSISRQTAIDWDIEAMNVYGDIDQYRYEWGLNWFFEVK